MGNTLKLKVTKVIKQTPDAVTLQFKHPLFQKIAYKPGQFLTLILTINGQEYRRAYSINTLDDFDKNIEVTIKKVLGGTVSNFIFNKIKEGDKIKIHKPLGNFIYEHKPTNKRILLVGGGSGITPLMAILKSILFKGTTAKVSLLFANRDDESVIFKSILKEYAKQFEDRFELLHILGKKKSLEPSIEGVLSEVVFDKIVAENRMSFSNVDQVYMCGPEGFMQSAESCLKKQGISEKIIFTEKFTADPIKASDAGIENPSTILVKVPNKEEIQYVHIEPKQSLLEALLKANYNIMYSCGSGICGSCKCKLVNGDINMGMTLGLTEDDKQNQIILPCVSYPKKTAVTLELLS